jgi:hypothetical protein
MPKFEYPTTTPGQLAARSENAIAVTELVTRKNTDGSVTKVEPYYFINIKDSNKIVIRNDKKELLNGVISFSDGLTYSNVKDYKFLANLISISQDTSVLNTDLGLDWLIPVLKVHYHVHMVRQSATTTTIIQADLSVWEKALVNLDENDKNEIIDKLISILKPTLSNEQLNTFESFKIPVNTVIDGKDSIPTNDTTTTPDPLMLNAAIEQPLELQQPTTNKTKVKS